MEVSQVKPAIIPLQEVKEGESAIIRELHGGKQAKEKLISLGIIPGVTVSVLNGKKNHPYLLSINESRVMVGYGLARKILVSLSVCT